MGFDGPVTGEINEVVVVRIDIDGYIEEKVFFYVVLRLATYDLILGMLWFRKQDIRLYPQRSWLEIRSTGTRVRNRTVQKDQKLDYTPVLAAAFDLLTCKTCQWPAMEVFMASLADIEKALICKPATNLKTKLPSWCLSFLDLFDLEQVEQLSPLRGPGADHNIELEKVDSKTPAVP